MQTATQMCAFKKLRLLLWQCAKSASTADFFLKTYIYIYIDRHVCIYLYMYVFDNRVVSFVFSSVCFFFFFLFLTFELYPLSFRPFVWYFQKKKKPPSGRSLFRIFLCSCTVMFKFRHFVMFLFPFIQLGFSLPSHAADKVSAARRVSMLHVRLIEVSMSRRSYPGFPLSTLTSEVTETAAMRENS